MMNKRVSCLLVVTALALFLTFLFFKRDSIFAENSDSKSDVVQRLNVYRHVDSRPLLGFPNYREDTKLKFISLIQRKASSLDPALVEYVRQVMDPPAPWDAIKMSRALSKTPQAAEIDKILNGKKGGFFVEAGGNDGERSSNTIWFEKKKKWSGLLVEPDPYFYTQLIGKNRYSWSINACISPYDYVSEITFEQSLGGSGKLNLKSTSGKFKVPCFPLATMLAALRVSEVDYFSLDVEGAEGIILKSIPFDKLNIKTLSVEYRHGDKSWYLEMMDKNGYEKRKDLIVHDPKITLYVDDFIFAKKNLK